MGEDLLVMDIQEIIEKEAQEEGINVKAKNEVIHGVYFRIKVGYRKTKFHGETKTAYTILCMEEIEDTSTTEHSVMPNTPTSSSLKRKFSTPTKTSGIPEEVIHTPPTPANKDGKLKSIRIE
ncbi:unnamed protein product [Cuscuta epithymum]|uniref:Uncharacterized protein n=1 Tax=Cuscuta epithymum TaxID=186058 RepID=A0AAV0D586_9ASTE|nr:unnamed protein product [Cuscuta epithymum]CAH9118739.1 unnamed protein product [Cuscuta epithymum]